MYKIAILICMISVLLFGCSSQTQSKPTSSTSEQKQPDIVTVAIDLLKRGKYDEANVTVFNDISYSLAEETGFNDISKGKSKKEQDEINIYRYANAKLKENTDPKLALSYLEYMSPIDGVINQQELDAYKAGLKKKVDNLNSPEELKKSGVHIGMTQDEVLKSSWGKREKINKTTVKNIVHEQWVYKGGYLYFDNGILTAIQN